MKYYDFMIANAKRYLRGVKRSEIINDENINAFQIAEVLAIACVKVKEDVLVDLTIEKEEY